MTDITREWLSAPINPGDPATVLTRLQDHRWGDEYMLSSVSACLHSGTHMVAPAHYIPDGDTVETLPPEKFIGECTVAEHDGLLLGEAAEALLPQAKSRILLKGCTGLDESAAFVLADAGVELIGTEGAVCAFGEMSGKVHRLLLDAGVLLLEGLDLTDVKPGTYLLIAAPLKIAGAESSPVRALLLEREGVDWNEHFWR